MLTACTDETGTGLMVFATSPTLTTPILGTVTSGDISACTSTSMVMVTPVLGTPTSGTLTNTDGYPECLSIALGDESTVLAAASTSVAVVSFHAPYAMTLTDIKAGLTVAGTGAALVTVDVHVAGTTVMSTTKVTIDASEKTSGTAATQPVLTTTSVAADALVEVFVDLVDTDNVAAGLKVYLIGYQT
jgi:hypothetical protein